MPWVLLLSLGVLLGLFRVALRWRGRWDLRSGLGGALQGRMGGKRRIGHASGNGGLVWRSRRGSGFVRVLIFGCVGFAMSWRVGGTVDGIGWKAAAIWVGIASSAVRWTGW